MLENNVDTSLENNVDTSLEDFLLSLSEHIIKDKIQNSFRIYEYKRLTHKNKLYQAIETYKNNKTIFYSKIITDYPEITIKYIREINLGENVNIRGRGAYPNGTYFLEFVVYYEKNS